MKRKISDLRGLLTAVLLCFVLSATAQVSVTGIVQDKSGEPLIGATVQEKGNTANGTATGIDGDFSLKVKSAKSHSARVIRRHEVAGSGSCRTY